MNPDSETPGRWLGVVTFTQWVVLLAASAGWVFDVYEGQLFTVFKTPMLRDLGVEKSAIEWQANVGLAAFLLGGAAGGLFFGMLGDRLGRVRVLGFTILVYSIFSGLTAFAQTTVHVHVLRFLVALGAGGEWAVAAALVAETFPTQARATASGVFHASSILGAMLASVSGAFLVGPSSWRWGFLLGVAPALLVLWIRMGLKEPERWTAARDKDDRAGSEPDPKQLGDPREFLRVGPLRNQTLIGLGLATVGLASYWGIFAWAPELVRLVLGDNASEAERQSSGSFTYLVMNGTGGLLGLLAFAPLASWRGRRFAFAFYHVGAAVTAPLAFLAAGTLNQAIVLLSVMAFFVLGMHAGYAVYFPELFPTRLRASGSSICFNLGRVLGALVLLVRGGLGERLGLRWAVVAMSGLFWMGLLLLVVAPETKGRDLPE